MTPFFALLCSGGTEQPLDLANATAGGPLHRSADHDQRCPPSWAREKNSRCPDLFFNSNLIQKIFNFLCTVMFIFIFPTQFRYFIHINIQHIILEMSRIDFYCKGSLSRSILDRSPPFSAPLKSRQILNIIICFTYIVD